MHLSIFSRAIRAGLKTCLVCSLSLLTAMAYAQSQPESSEPPPKNYWQQQVDYAIDVTLNNDGRTITGTQTFTYHNNSPDTLYELYLKAFPNSARKGSLMDKHNRKNEDYSIARAKSDKFGSLIIKVVRNVNGQPLDAELDDTIYRITLDKPIPPKAKAEFYLEFTTILPVDTGDRHGYIKGQSKAAYWYPQVCVYDRKMGWVNAPYLGRGECYGDFGDFTVNITAPEDRVVVATGLLTNKTEVMPNDLRSLLDIANFLKPKDQWPSLQFDTAKTKVWRFYAKKVNDFAWVASKDFCIDDTEYNGVQIECYARRAHAKGWVNAVEYSKQTLVTFSELYGNYRWPAIKVTDSYDGMEYPMLTFCSGDSVESPTFDLLVYHEIGHFWFMGLVGSNQVDRACLDEGFTTSAEIIAMEKYKGRAGNNVNWSRNFFKNAFYPLDEDRDARGYRIYLEWARSGYDLPMIIPSDNATEYWAYRNSSYYKPVVMHFTLRSIYGDSLYFAAMKRYANRWMFRHPYEEDFIESFSGSVNERLDEYFAQWYRSRRVIDYEFAGKKRIDTNQTEIKLKSPGDFVTPVDVAVISATDDTTFYTVNPEGHDFIKPGYNSAGTWRQYRQPSFEHTFTVSSGDVKKVVVDPHRLLPDVNRLNNESGFLFPIETHIDPLFYDVPSMHEYSLRWRPDIWYDRPNGLIIGTHFHGSYIKKTSNFSLDLGIGTESEEFQMDFEFSHQIPRLGRLNFTEGRYLQADFRRYYNYGFRKEFRKTWTGSNYDEVSVKFNQLSFTGIQPQNFMPAHAMAFTNSGLWSARTSQWLSFTNESHQSGMIFGHESIDDVRIGYSTSDNDAPAFAQFYLMHRFNVNVTSATTFTVQGAYFSTTHGELSEEHLFHISRPRPIDEFTSSKIFRSPGTYPVHWADDFYLNSDGVRGYQDRALYGRSGGAVSFFLHTNSLLKKTKVQEIPYIGSYISNHSVSLFLQCGWIHQSDDSTRGVYETQVSSGQVPDYLSAGISFTSPSIWCGQKMRLDFPLYLSRPLPGEEKLDFRFSVAWIMPLENERWSPSLNK